MSIIACTQMRFYGVNDYFVFWGKSDTTYLVEGGFYSIEIFPKLAAYGVRANHHIECPIFYMVVEVKTGQCDVKPNKGGCRTCKSTPPNLFVLETYSVYILIFQYACSTPTFEHWPSSCITVVLKDNTHAYMAIWQTSVLASIYEHDISTQLSDA